MRARGRLRDVKPGGARNPVRIRGGRATVTGERALRCHGLVRPEGGGSDDPGARRLVRRGTFIWRDAVSRGGPNGPFCRPAGTAARAWPCAAARGAVVDAFGEPRVQDAIDIEQQKPVAQAALQLAPASISDWTVSRDEQRGGLFLATALYGITLGGLFGTAFAMLRGRGRERSDWQLATRLAAGLFVAVVLVPLVKYPANPPAVGNPDTIGERTWYYLILLAGSLLALLAAARVAWAIPDEDPPWRRPLLAGATFVIVAAGLALALPAVQEVPPDFPAPLIWEFRLSSLGTQAVLWTALGMGYGIGSWRAGARTGRAATAG